MAGCPIPKNDFKITIRKLNIHICNHTFVRAIIKKLANYLYKT